MWILVEDQSGRLVSQTRVQPDTGTTPAGMTWSGPHDIDLSLYHWDQVTRKFIQNVVLTSQQQRMSLEAQADDALVRNKTFVDTPNAQLTNAQVVNHLKDLTRQMNTLIRLSQDRLLVDNQDT